MSMFPKENPIYDDGRTKQAFKDQTDINKMLKRSATVGALSHLERYGGEYGDFAEFDFFEAQVQLARCREIFDHLPSEVRKEFAGDPQQFFNFCNDPENVTRLATLLPELAEPGRIFPVVDRGAAAQNAPTEDPPPGTSEPPPGEGDPPAGGGGE